eukprot:CAMPEP_0174380984 /NCGR_PEP_ID=MMETSP0811_2-20130205/123714_1 /TAXON_ID=73025 ORGANISM="Eutreptiella gymnastica-like, Strain CCMP1594" /NCGR_SAMPLE_ID=MMETSP0811_2 /ASSEMBLY_ACC=CAM_ASM_000667 /LENGTH=97 /DNA_ID=CAMNT_0015533983 /DNA_START=2391 /DNA_END=2680 /DNA_ORIENTATION=-
MRLRLWQDFLAHLKGLQSGHFEVNFVELQQDRLSRRREHGEGARKVSTRHSVRQNDHAFFFDHAFGTVQENLASRRIENTSDVLTITPFLWSTPPWP